MILIVGVKMYLFWLLIISVGISTSADDNVSTNESYKYRDSTKKTYPLFLHLLISTLKINNYLLSIDKYAGKYEYKWNQEKVLNSSVNFNSDREETTKNTEQEVAKYNRSGSKINHNERDEETFLDVEKLRNFGSGSGLGNEETMKNTKHDTADVGTAREVAQHDKNGVTFIDDEDLYSFGVNISGSGSGSSSENEETSKDTKQEAVDGSSASGDDQDYKNEETFIDDGNLYSFGVSISTSGSGSSSENGETTEDTKQEAVDDSSASGDDQDDKNEETFIDDEGLYSFGVSISGSGSGSSSENEETSEDTKQEAVDGSSASGDDQDDKNEETFIDDEDLYFFGVSISASGSGSSSENEETTEGTKQKAAEDVGNESEVKRHYKNEETFTDNEDYDDYV